MRKQQQENKVWCAFILTDVREVLASLLGVQVPPSRGNSFPNMLFGDENWPVRSQRQVLEK